MSFYSVFLALLSACLHVVMHVTLKSARDRTSFVWWTWLWASLIFLPVPIFFWQSGSALTWAILIISAVFEALYFVAVSKAYKSGDLSVVYPLARGTAPLFILLWSTLLLEERPTLGGLCGVTLIIAGLCVVNLRWFGSWRDLRQSLWQSGTRWALLAGFCISCYTTLDKAGVRLIAPLLYTYLAMAMTLAWLTPGTLRAVGWRGLMAEWRSSGYKSMIAGFTSMAAYAIVLYVMWTGAPASYVGAMREISVVFGAVVGVVFLKEQGTVTRVFGSSLIASGVGVIALLG
jgi:drug/metabolite transporter (DMT)-like permease